MLCVNCARLRLRPFNRTPLSESDGRSSDNIIVSFTAWGSDY